MAFTHAANAADPALSKQYSACMDKAGGVTAGMIDCIGAEVQRQDAKLNAAYKALMSSVVPARQTQLRDAQRAWIKYRDANCAFYLDPDGGTLARVEANDCVLTSTAARAAELERLKQ
ncbi:lysozyme inhibitor LprI family protein [Variovorax sp. KK3]|uniref:lysozyme inhibitor LprI family protein n=1 Tax=Variovorax sp. KK3 TaxID=1855728 RepID=UPI00097BD126|nr:lysozyme inhibitor LprI family protein [Variovorax sp. KK3]